jgi:hypothetical protein
MCWWVYDVEDMEKVVVMREEKRASRSSNCCENINRKLTGKTSRRMGNMECPQAQAFIGRLPRGSWAELGRKQERLLIDALLPELSCQLSQLSQLPPPPPRRSPTLYPFSTPLWSLTNVKPRRTWPPIRSFPAFNPANPPRLSSPSLEIKSPHSTNP